MLFNTQPFAVFFVLVFCGYWLLRRTGMPRILLLLAASYLFYGWWDWRFLGLILFSTVLDYVVGGAMARADRPGRRRFSARQCESPAIDCPPISGVSRGVRSPNVPLLQWRTPARPTSPPSPS